VCSVLHRVAACWNVLWRVAAYSSMQDVRYDDRCCSVLHHDAGCCSGRQCVSVYCSVYGSVLQCTAVCIACVCCSVWQRVAACCSVLQCLAVCCSVLQCVIVCCSVLQWIAVCCTVLQYAVQQIWYRERRSLLYKSHFRRSLLKVFVAGLFGGSLLTYTGLFWRMLWSLLQVSFVGLF